MNIQPAFAISVLENLCRTHGTHETKTVDAHFDATTVTSTTAYVKLHGFHTDKDTDMNDPKANADWEEQFLGSMSDEELKNFNEVDWNDCMDMPPSPVDGLYQITISEAFGTYTFKMVSILPEIKYEYTDRLISDFKFVYGEKEGFIFENPEETQRIVETILQSGEWMGKLQADAWKGQRFVPDYGYEHDLKYYE